MDKQAVRAEIQQIVATEQEEIQKYRAMRLPKPDRRSDEEIAADIWLDRHVRDLEKDFAYRKHDLTSLYTVAIIDIRVENAREEEDRKKEQS